MIFAKTHLIPSASRLIQDDPNDHYIRVIFEPTAAERKQLLNDCMPLFISLAEGMMFLASLESAHEAPKGMVFSTRDQITARYMQQMCLAGATATGRADNMSIEDIVREVAEDLVGIINEVHIHSRHMDLVPGADIVRVILRQPMAPTFWTAQEASVTLDLYIDLTQAVQLSRLDELYKASQPGGLKQARPLNQVVSDVLVDKTAGEQAPSVPVQPHAAHPVVSDLPIESVSDLPGTPHPIVSEVPIESVSDLPTPGARPIEMN